MSLKKALLGIHNPSVAKAFAQSCKVCDYQADSVETAQEMLAKARQGDYDAYIMDVNLGYPDSPNISPAKDIYSLVKQRVEAGEAKFLAISANSEAIALARKEGIPTEEKYKLNIIDFLRR